MVAVSNWKSDVFEEGLLKITHYYYEKITNQDKSLSYYRGVIHFTNVGKVPIIQLRCKLDLDDIGQVWDAELVESDGSKIGEKQTFELGELAENQTVTKKYWMRCRFDAFESTSTTENFEVRINIMPEYVVSHTESNPFTSTQTVSAP